ncbi:MAG TPA: methyltransferase domain-containing protein [Bacteroidia bacterium]|jgi:SAM-dependent methyltransferase|nr:methyltransferase domain-containing protein [Bacteroidia bacterium]
MFFPDRIKNIQPGDKVLEIGPGASPHQRSDVLLELKYDAEEDRQAQFGHTGALQTDKKIVYYDGTVFPFDNQSFDYIICSHVLEHVPDPEAFLKEIFRVGKKGYFEYPMAYYDYLYNFEVHLNFLKYSEGILYYMKKNETGLEAFRPIQEFFHESLRKGHVTLVDSLIPLIMQGFEWNKPFAVRKTNKLETVLWDTYEIPQYLSPLTQPRSAAYHLKALVKKVLFMK